MPLSSLIVLAILFFATSVVGVVTGSNSLITVPVMFQFGVDEKVAIATNMFGLTFMAIGGTIPFVRQGSIKFEKLPPLIVLTLLGSAVGALLVGVLTNQAIRIVVFVGMLAVSLFILIRRDGSAADVETKPGFRGSGLIVPLLVFLLAIYGGLYSGGYVTILTAVFVAFSGMTFTESVGVTKFINVFSSGIATLIFMWQGLVDYKLGLVLSIAMFAGAFVGAHFAIRMSEVWLRRIFLTTVFLLAAKTLIDFV
jgi:uncharacterized membrane protein YfcA